jgi:hypothetical protein
LCTACFPFRPVWNVEDQKVIPRRCLPHLVSASTGKLYVIRLLEMTEYNAVKTAMIFEACQYGEAEAFRVHFGDRRQIVRRPRYPQCGTRFQGSRSQF